MIKLYFYIKENEKINSDMFSRSILGEYLSVDGNCLMILRNKHGKPYLRDYPDLHFNISHTKGAMVCAVADLPVGVDIERVKTYNKRLVARFFTQAERNYVFADNENQDERFAEIWTKKEAYVKWQDKGMEIPFESFNVLGNTQISTLSYRDYCVAICTADSSIFKGLIDNLAEVAS